MPNILDPLKQVNTKSDSDAPVEIKTYTHEECMGAATRYFKGDELAASVWINKYALKDSAGNIYESNPDQMHQRLAKELARTEKNYPNSLTKKDIYNLLKDFKYIVPQGGPMTGIGNNYQVASLSNCFVIGNSGLSDSYGGIMKIDEEQVQLMKRRGGVGHDLSHIRPKGSSVKNSALTSTGVVPFMERFSNSTREVAQDGRRGALMLSISINHPDAEQFIDAKLDGTKVTGANVSVKVDDAFMKAVVNDEEYVQKYPIYSETPATVSKTSARKLWNKIVKNAWKSAEPGVLFWDNIINESIPDCYEDQGFKTVSTNPCGEIPLCPYDSCRLLAINLYSYVKNPFTAKASFDFKLFKNHVDKAQRLMDDIIDLEIEKIDRILNKIKSDPEDNETKTTEARLWIKIKEQTLKGRRTGVGITAEGDMMAALGICYGSQQATDFSVEVHKTLAIEAYRTSVKMAQERGAFEVYDAKKEEKNPFVHRIKLADPALYAQMKKHGRRNIALLTIAPTGTTSLMTQTTSGIEPVFRIAYKRRRKINPNDRGATVDFTDDNGDNWQEYNVFHHKFTIWLETNGYKMDEVANYDDDALKILIESSPYHKATAENIDWVKKVNLQGSVQKWVDHSISATVNVPEKTPVEKIDEIYRTAWKAGCKGITVYREGSRSGVLVAGNEKNKESFPETRAPKRPDKIQADVLKFMNNDEQWMAVVGLIDDKPYEIFTGRVADSFLLPNYIKSGRVIKGRDSRNKGRYDFQYIDKDGYRVTIEGLSRSFNPEYWNYAKLISGVLRHGMPVLDLVDLVENLNLIDESLNTWKRGVIRILTTYIPSGTAPENSTCSECGEDALVYQEGCLKCHSCGHSKCG